MKKRNRKVTLKSCPECGISFTGCSDTCSYACANTRRTRFKAEEFERLRKSVKAEMPSIDQVKRLRAFMESNGLGPKSHEHSVVSKLPLPMRAHWFGLPEKKFVKMAIIFADDLSKAQCICGAWIRPNAKKDWAACSQPCYKRRYSLGISARRRSKETLLESAKTKRFSRFTERDVENYRRLIPSSRIPENDRILILRRSNPVLADKYTRLRVVGKKYGARLRDYLARGGKEPRCLVCRKLFPLRSIKRPRFCSSNCSNGHEDTMSRRADTLVRNFGTDNMCRISKRKAKMVRLGKRTVKVEGFEPQAIAYMLERGVSPDRIKVGKEVPIIEYEIGRTKHSYYPDILVGEDLIVEVKSDHTLTMSKEAFHKNVAKAKAARAAGYRFRMLVMERNGRRLRLPAGWTSMSRASVLRHLKTKQRYPLLETK